MSLSKKKLKIKPGSTHHSLLCFARSQKRPFTCNQVSFVLSGKMRYRQDVIRVANSLMKRGYIEQVGLDSKINPSWVITHDGLRALLAARTSSEIKH